MPEPITIALAGFNLASLIVAGISSERARVWKQKALTASRFHMDQIVAAGCATDKAESLQRLLDDAEHQAFIDRETFERRFIEKAGVLRTVTAERDAAVAKLARFDGAARPRGAGGRFGART